MNGLPKVFPGLRIGSSHQFTPSGASGDPRSGAATGQHRAARECQKSKQVGSAGSPFLKKNHQIAVRPPTLKDVAALMENCNLKNIIVMVGAGISTSVGIPDFRTPGTGLYSNLEKFRLPYPEAIFDIQYFTKHPEAFYTLTKELYPGNFKPSLTHHFIKLLEVKKRLKRVFTQNIDTLERLAGISNQLIVEAHGSFATSRCLNCKATLSSDKFLELLGDDGKPVRCPQPSCRSNSTALVKPNIVFYGEGLPQRFFSHLTDFDSADLLIVMGTSLHVQPFASLIDAVPANCPRVLINLERVGEKSEIPTGGFDFKGTTRGGREMVRDVLYLGTADDGVKELCENLGWMDELMALHDPEYQICPLTSPERAKQFKDGSEVFVAEVQEQQVDQLSKLMNRVSVSTTKPDREAESTVQEAHKVVE